MILFGHPDVESSSFYRIGAIEEIRATPPNSSVFFDYDASLARYAKAQGLCFAIHVKHTQELILAHALGASFFIVDKALSLTAQKIAEHYLFDGKILLRSHDEGDIEFAALHGIDGIVFENALRSL